MTLAKNTPALITCSACGSQMSLDVAIAHIAARAAVRRCLESMGEVGLGLMSYIALHRSRSRQLTWEKSAKLLDEILSMIDQGWIERNHDRHAVNAALWIAAFAEVKDASTKTLTLPLDGHGYLLQVLASLATKANAAKDREQEALARGETPNGRSAAHQTTAYEAIGCLTAVASRIPNLSTSGQTPLQASNNGDSSEKLLAIPEHARTALANFGKAKRMDAAVSVVAKPVEAAGINPREGAKPKAIVPTFATVSGKKELVEIVGRKGQKLTVRLLDVAHEFQENTVMISVKDLL